VADVDDADALLERILAVVDGTTLIVTTAVLSALSFNAVSAIS
jgi:hypothetical protein